MVASKKKKNPGKTLRDTINHLTTGQITVRVWLTFWIRTFRQIPSSHLTKGQITGSEVK